MKRKILFLFAIATSFTFLCSGTVSAANNVSGWAWSETIGWISFNCSDPGTCGNVNYGVNVDLAGGGNFSGYGWSENIGWIKFDPAAPYPSCNNTTCPGGSPNYSAKLDTATNRVTGWARACAGTVNGDCNSATRNDGWDGWILLGPVVNGATNNGVKLNTAVNPNEFSGWAWGSDVVGWISFNSKDCDPDGNGNPSDGPAQCVEAGRNYNSKPIPSYKVIISSVPSSASDPTNLKVMKDNALQYCGSSHAVNPPVSFQWEHPDQKSYILEIYKGANLVESSCAVAGCCNAASACSSKSYTAKNLLYDDSYSWRLKVWDNSDNESNWVSGPDFDTISYAYPNPDFDWVPAKIIVKIAATFTTKPGTFSNPNGGKFRWDFGDGSGANSPNNVLNDQVVHTYSLPNVSGYSVKLTATAHFDGEDHTCEKIWPTKVLFADPIWKEKAPPSK